jgi:hypothetical protein
VGNNAGVPPYPAARPTSEEYDVVLDTLNRYIRRLDQPTDEENASERRLRNRTAFGMAIYVLAFAALILSAVFKDIEVRLLIAFSVLLVLSAVVNGVALTRAFMEQKDTWSALKRPRESMIKALKSTYPIEENYVTMLLKHPTPTLQFVRARLTDRIDVQRERSDGIFGAISKVGLFPSVLAAIVTAVTATKGTFTWVTLAAAVGTGLLILNQNTAADFHMAAADTKLMLSLLDRAIALQEAQASNDTAAHMGNRPHV